MTQPRETLPVPVARYFDYALSGKRTMIAQTHLQQHGQLRLAADSKRWLDFTAQQDISKHAFNWRAKVKLPYFGFVEVTDNYEAGGASGDIKLFGWLPLAHDENSVELNTGSLLRYLAEAVWSPTALLPEAGVKWQSIDEQRAYASLSDHGIEVGLEFTFAETGEITKIYTPERAYRVGKTYELRAWEGHFSNYRNVDGIMVPLFGEVGWYSNQRLELVWRGTIDVIEHRLTIEK